VGEIEDEFDFGPGPIRAVDGGGFEFDGAVRIDDAAVTLGSELPTGDYETIAGLVIDSLGRIPEQGEGVVVAGWRLTAAQVDGLRVAVVTARREVGSG
jgi:CBS domain containing-hemolysin-like protein